MAFKEEEDLQPKKRKKEGDQKFNAGICTSSPVINNNTPQLPDLVIYKILQLLPTRLAIRASILSKQWQHVWSSFPVFSLDEIEAPHIDPYGWEAKVLHPKFVDFVTRYLNQLEKDNLSLDKFRLGMTYLDRRNDRSIINKWLSFALERNVKELYINLIDIDIQKFGYQQSQMHKGLGIFFGFHNYPLYHKVLNAKSLTKLSLDGGIHLQIYYGDIPISLPSLKFMSLKKLNLGGEGGFFLLLLGCPSIETLSIDSCYCSSNLTVSSSSLKSLEVIMMIYKYDIKVEANNLKSLKLGCREGMRDDFDFPYVGARKYIELFDVQLVGEWCEGLDSRFPLRESLILENCNAVDHVNFSEHMKRFEIKCYGYGPYFVVSSNLTGFRGKMTYSKKKVRIRDTDGI